MRTLAVTSGGGNNEEARGKGEINDCFLSPSLKEKNNIIKIYPH